MHLTTSHKMEIATLGPSYTEKCAIRNKVLLEGPDAAEACGSSGDGNKRMDFASTAHSVDQRCRSIGYPGIVRQQRSGTEYLSVPSLLQNCSSLVTLLAAGGSCRPQLPSVSETARRPSCSKTPSTSDNLTASVNNFNCTTVVSKSSGSGISNSHRGWRRIFSRRTACRPPAATDEQGLQLKAEEREQDLACSLLQLLEGIRQRTERLGILAGLTAGDKKLAQVTLPAPVPVTRLQREVLYFQTRWPKMMDAIGTKFTESGRAAKRQEENATARAKAEAGAKARNIAKMANMEAELRRMRAELRRYGRQIKLPQLQRTAKMPQTQPMFKRKNQDRTSEATTATADMKTPDEFAA